MPGLYHPLDDFFFSKNLLMWNILKTINILIFGKSALRQKNSKIVVLADLLHPFHHTERTNLVSNFFKGCICKLRGEFSCSQTQLKLMVLSDLVALSDVMISFDTF